MLRVGVFVFVIVKFGLRQSFARDALDLDVLGDSVLELHLGTEDDAVDANHLRGLELGVAETRGVVALALQGDVERAEVVEHYALTAQERLGDEGFDTCQHGHDVTLGTGGGEGDVFGELLKSVVTSLHGSAFEVVYIGILGVAALGHFVGNRHRFFLFRV